ncbi:MAG: 3-isopropylmalate dehydratase small subunit [Nitriliruptorales bacterium]|nr:3-isopropylmalate dehydratase small subunit [Nitriliruptorales bacterium]
MEPVDTITGTVCPIDANDVDTDQIIPKQFLKRIDRAGFGPFAFYEWRYDEEGEPKPDFPMNRPEHAGANILLAGRNFGCGSSREHAPWALEDAGFEAIIAPSFADIFKNNCAKIGLLTVELDDDTVRRLFDLVDDDPSIELTIDLEAQTVTGPEVDETFEVDPHTKHCLLNGLDDIALTLEHEDAISAFEKTRPAYRPRVPAGS